VPAPHPEEFRRRAVALARERTKPIAELAKELRISESCLRNWLAQADADDSGSDTQLTSKERKELTELRREKRRLVTVIPPARYQLRPDVPASLPAGCGWPTCPGFPSEVSVPRLNLASCSFRRTDLVDLAATVDACSTTESFSSSPRRPDGPRPTKRTRRPPVTSLWRSGRLWKIPTVEAIGSLSVWSRSGYKET
jgi:transposase